MKKGIIIGAIITILIFLVSAYISIFYIKDFKNYYSNEDFDIEKYISTIDKDGDGIDDQTDILNNVREYISKNPKLLTRAVEPFSTSIGILASCLATA